MHKVWSSTHEGNEKLSQTFKHSVANMAACYPIFLFFSLNQSGQFCGVAQLASDLNSHSTLITPNNSKTASLGGNFAVKWLFCKDIPNKFFKHLSNKLNENKPVANSRDTQEVSFMEGVGMLEIFRDFQEQTSIFNDFDQFERHLLGGNKSKKESIYH